MLRAIVNRTARLPPERQALAVAIQERDAAKAELDGMQAVAIGWDSSGKAAVRKAEADFAAANAAIETARAATVDFLVASASGSAASPALSVGDAYMARQVAKDNLAAAESALTLLRSRIPAAEGVLNLKEGKVSEAVSAVLKSSPEVAAVLDEVERAANVLWQHGAVLQALWSANGLDMDNVQTEGRSTFSQARNLRHLLSVAPERWTGLPPVPAFDAWTDAFKALHHDATAVLPTL